MSDVNSTTLLGTLFSLVLALAFPRRWKVGSREPFLPMTKWGTEFGPIFSLKLGNQTMIVLSGPAEVKELMDRRSATTSDRPPRHVANDLITNGYHLLAMGYGSRWRMVRKIIHQYLTVRMCEEQHQKFQAAESTQMIWDVLEQPEDYFNRVRRYSPGVILSIVYGRRGPTWDGAVSSIYKVMDPWSEIVETGATPPVDFFPFLKKLPNFLSPWREKALKVRAMELALYGGLAAKSRLVELAALIAGRSWIRSLTLNLLDPSLCLTTSRWLTSEECC